MTTSIPVRRLRIGLDVSTLVIPNKNGYENYVRELVSALSHLDENAFAGLDVHLFCNVGNRLADPRLLGHFQSELSSFRRWIYRPSRGFGYALPYMARAARLDLFHFPVHIWSGSMPCRVVSTLHDACGLHWLKNGGTHYPEIMALEEALQKQVATSHAFIAVSQVTKRDMMDLFGVADDYVRVVHHGVGHGFADGPRTASDVRNLYGLTNYILSVNALQGNKNYPRLIDAFTRLYHAGDTERVLVIVGRDGWGADEVHSAIARSGLVDSIRLLGYVPDQHLPGLYAGADLVVNASECEGFGMSILEALQAGAVVAASDGTALSEVGGDAVIKFQPRDVNSIASTLRLALDDRALRLRVREAATQRLHAFSWRQTALATLDVYRSMGNRV